MPIAPLGSMAALRRRVATALCANEGLGSEADAVRVIQAGVADLVCFSPFWVGSLRRFHTLSHLAHLTMLPGITDGAQQTAAVMSGGILSKPLPIAAGPAWGRIERPGLGVEVGPDRLARAGFRENGRFVPWAA